MINLNQKTFQFSLTPEAIKELIKRIQGNKKKLFLIHYEKTEQGVHLNLYIDRIPVIYKNTLVKMKKKKKGKQ